MLRKMMTLMRLLALVGAVMIGGTVARPATANADSADISMFHTELAPHGRWFEHERYGYVWSPHVTEADWRPYTRGRWAWTDEHGWYWVSDEEWGWGPYHYGRWALDDEFGWVWIPGTEWGPAWVAWRESDDYIGWAPLPPDSEFGDGGVRFATTYYDNPRWTPVWCFVAPRYMTYNRGVYVHLLPYRRNVTVITRTRFVNNYVFVNNRIVNRGVDFRFVARRGGIQISPMRISVVGNRRGLGVHGGGVINVFRPQISRAAVSIRPQQLVGRDQIRADVRLPGLAFTARSGDVPRGNRDGGGGSGVNATGVAIGVGAAAGAAGAAIIMKNRRNDDRGAGSGGGNVPSAGRNNNPDGSVSGNRRGGDMSTGGRNQGGDRGTTTGAAIRGKDTPVSGGRNGDTPTTGVRRGDVPTTGGRRGDDSTGPGRSGDTPAVVRRANPDAPAGGRTFNPNNPNNGQVRRNGDIPAGQARNRGGDGAVGAPRGGPPPAAVVRRAPDAPQNRPVPPKRVDERDGRGQPR